MEAWITMVELQRRFPPVDVQYLRCITLPATDDDRIGLWVNGMREKGVLLLMQQKVPCFIVHEFPSNSTDIRSAVPEALTFYDFAAGTDIVYLVRHNEYQLLAEAQGRLDAILRSGNGRGGHVPALPQDEA
jgi:hypothetical protein